MQLKVQESDAMGQEEKREEARKDRRDQEIIGQMWVLIAVGLSVFLGGFAVWSLDNAYCSKLIKWRREIGLPWGILLEGHGWWHLMTGYGAYFYIVWGVWLRQCLNGKADEYELVWPSWLASIPRVVKREYPAGMSGAANGDAKKTS